MRQALWFSEGIADYFGGHAQEFDEGRRVFVPGLINEERVRTLVDARKRGDLMPVEELLEYRRAAYVRDKENPQKQRKVLNAYAEGWALNRLLQDWKKERYGRRYLDYLKEEFAGRSGRAAFVKVFGASALPVIQREFLEMIDELGRALKEGRIINGRLRKKP